MNQSNGSIKPKLRLRCQNPRCKKMLGIVNDDCNLVYESNRSGNHIKVIIERGTVICKNCGTEIYWDSTKTNEVTDKEMHHG